MHHEHRDFQTRQFAASVVTDFADETHRQPRIQFRAEFAQARKRALQDEAAGLFAHTHFARDPAAEGFAVRDNIFAGETLFAQPLIRRLRIKIRSFLGRFALARAEMALLRNRAHDAQTLAEEIANQAHGVENIFIEGWALRVLGEAVARLEPPRWEEAEAHLADGLRLFEEGDERLEAALTHLVWGRALTKRGEKDSAREHFEKAAAQYETSGLTQLLEETRALMAELSSEHRND